MATKVNIPFVGPAYRARSVNLNAQRCVNLYPEVGGPNGKNVIALFGTPGLAEFADVGGNGLRGMYHVPSRNLFTVSDSKFKEVNRAGVVTERGTLNSSTGRVSMADNGTQLMIVDGVDGYIYNLDTEVFTQITDPDFPGADTVDFVDGYFAVNKPDTGRWYVSDLLDGLAWTATAFTTAESSSDNLSAVIKIGSYVYAIGRYTSEVYYNAAAATFPFVRIGAGVINWGIEATFSLTEGDGTAFWVSRDRTGKNIVVRLNNLDVQRVSNHAIEFAMSQMSTTSDAFSYVYTDEGHSFLVITFPTGNQTWAYDMSTNMWHERQSYTEEGPIRHRANAHFFFAGEQMVGDFESGKIYKMSTRFLDDDGDPIERIRATQHIHQTENRISYFSLQVGFEEGVGLVSGQGEDPQAMLRWSDDGGHTWSHEKWRTIGKIGKYGTRVKWNRLGTGRNRVFEIKISDPVKVVIIDAVAEIEVLAA